MPVRPFALHPALWIPLARPRITRARRVCGLSALIVAMGLTDLACTLAYVSNMGMVELNPIARLLIQTGGAGALTCFKALSLLVCAGLLVRLRSHRQAEAAAWIGVVLMTALTVHWASYNAAVAQLTPYLSESLVQDALWTRLPDSAGAVTR